MKDYMFEVNDDDKVPYDVSYILYTPRVRSVAWTLDLPSVSNRSLIN